MGNPAKGWLTVPARQEGSEKQNQGYQALQKIDLQKLGGDPTLTPQHFWASLECTQFRKIPVNILPWMGYLPGTELDDRGIERETRQSPAPGLLLLQPWRFSLKKIVVN